MKAIYNKTITVSQYLNQWLNDYCIPRLARNTVTAYRVNVERHINHYLGDVLLSDLQPESIHSMYSALRSGGLSASSVFLTHSVLRRALNCAVKQRILEDNPMQYVYSPRKSSYRAVVISGNDVVKLLSACRDSEIYIAVLLASCLGLRSGEVLGLQWSDIDFSVGTLEIRHTATIRGQTIYLTSPKTESSQRTLLLAPALLSELMAYKKLQPYNPNGFVVSRSDGSTMTRAILMSRYREALASSGLPAIRFHDLRHSNATIMLRNNVPAKVVQSILGHSKISTTLDLYSHVMLDMQAPAVAVVQNLLG